MTRIRHPDSGVVVRALLAEAPHAVDTVFAGLPAPVPVPASRRGSVRDCWT